MLDLSPTKLLIIFVVVVVLLGPKRLPEVARQLGAGWRKLRNLHGQLDRELRQTMPDLPSSQDIVRFARSPITLLNQLADNSGKSTSPDGTEAAESDGANGGASDRTSSNGIGSNGTGSNGAGPNGAGPNGVGAKASGQNGAGARGAGQNGAGARRVPVNGAGRAEWRGGRAPGERGTPVVGTPTMAGLDTDDPNLN